MKMEIRNNTDHSERIVFVLLYVLSVAFTALLLFNRQITIRNIAGAAGLGLILLGALLFSAKTIFTYTQESLGCRMIYCVCLLFAVMTLFSAFMQPVLTWDTYQMYDMSKYVFSDFGYMVQIRQHIANTHYEMAFPPIYPVLMAILNLIFDTGINSAVFLSAVSSILLPPALAKIGFTIRKQNAVALAAFTILSGQLYCWTIDAGVCQTLGFLLIACIVDQLVSGKLCMRTVCSCGILAAAGLMNRFDFLAISAVLFLCILYLSYGREKISRIVSYLFAYGSILVVGCLPWIVYSYTHFGKLFVTDNGRRLFNIPDTRPSTFFSQSHPAETIRDDFGRWLQALLGRMKITIISEIEGIWIYTLIVEICVLLIPVLIALTIRKNKRGTQSLRIASFLLEKREVICVFFCVLAQEALFALTGYQDVRYHLPLYCLIQFLCFDFFLKELDQLFAWLDRKRIRQIEAAFLVIVCLLGYVKVGSVRNPLRLAKNISSGGYTTEMYLNDDEMYMKSVLEEDCSCLCLYRSEDAIDIAKFSALSEIPNMISPSNISQENVTDFVDTFDINYLYSSDESLVQIFQSAFIATNVGIPNLYRIEKSD